MASTEQTPVMKKEDVLKAVLMKALEESGTYEDVLVLAVPKSEGTLEVPMIISTTKHGVQNLIGLLETAKLFIFAGNTNPAGMTQACVNPLDELSGEKRQ
jgi:hypothetical protein